MTLTETLRRLAEKVGGPLETEWVSDVQMFLSKCTPTNVIALCAVADAARRMREAMQTGENAWLSSLKDENWVSIAQQQSAAARKARDDLDAALAALDRVEG